MTISEGIGVDVFVNDTFALVMVRGDVDLGSAPELGLALAALPPETCVIVNMAGVDFADSTCLNLLVAHHNRLPGGGGALHVEEPSSAMRRVLGMTGLDRILVGP